MVPGFSFEVTFEIDPVLEERGAGGVHIKDAFCSHIGLMVDGDVISRSLEMAKALCC